MRIFVCLLASMAAWGESATFDVLLRHGRIIDGTGAPWYVGDVGIRGDSIAAVGFLGQATGQIEIDLRGLVIAPGFIDPHSHARGGLFDSPAAENYIRQGVTTVIEGPDGSSPIPLRPFLDQVGARRIGINFATLAGHGSIRAAVMGSENRPARPDELDRMRSLARQAMLDGAFGLSTGLFYPPGNYAPTSEVVELAKVAGALGGVYTSHMRDEAAGVLDSVRETIQIGEQGHLPTQITHHKIIGGPNRGRSVETLRLVAEARQRGVDATIDQYPYTASSTGLTALLPQWSQAGGRKALLERLAAPESRARIKTVIVDKIKFDRGAGDPKNVQIASCEFDPSLAGKTLADVTRDRRLEPTPENAAEVAMSLIEKGTCSAVYHAINEDDVERILRSPFTMICSDGGIPKFGVEVPHPRNYGAFARVVSRYVRERQAISLEDAVFKMAGFPAARFSLTGRGLLRPGLKADIAVFDPDRVRDKAEFGNPHQYAEGFVHVLVNGQFELRDGKMTGALAGRVLYGPAHAR